jgi:hypothetical protein
MRGDRGADECVVCQSTAEPLNDDGWCCWCIEAERCEVDA